jgi:hypothetical protein
VEPFDRSKDSPIAKIRELQARAPGSVVAESGMSGLQREAYVQSETETRLLALAGSSSPPDLLVISGSAGSGKSALIDRILHAQPDLFESVVQDATHSNSPSESQADLLIEFFEPFRDGATSPPAKPRLVAANIGLLLAFFSTLREADTPGEFGALEAVLKHSLGVSREPPPEVPWSFTILNLDLRPTAGPDGLLLEMLQLADFRNPDGIAEGAERCESCEVQSWCPARTNSIIAGSAAAAVDRLASQAAAERGRHDSPRDLWDLVARLICGDDPFDGDEDPCDTVAAAAQREDQAWVWDRLLPRRLFDTGGNLGPRIHRLDPSFRPGYLGHRTLSGAGVEPAADAAAIRALDPGGAEALDTAAHYLEAGDRNAGRPLVAALYLKEPAGWSVGDDPARRFGKLLSEYEDFSEKGGAGYPALDDLKALIERALGCSFGVLDGGKPYVSVKAYDPRDPSRIFVNAELRYEPEIYGVLKDPAGARDPEGAVLVGHRPLAVTVMLGGVEVAVTLPVFRLLVAAAKGTLASTADLERFYGLRRAVESLARASAAAGGDLVIERPETARRYHVTRSPGLGEEQVVSVREVGR